MFMRSFLNALTMTPISKLPSKNYPWWILASMRIEVGFDQGPLMNGINFKIVQFKLDSCFGDDQYIVCTMTEMRQLMNCLSILLKPCFINSLQGIGIISMFILLLVKKSTRDCCRIRNCAGTTMDIMVSQIVWFLTLWRWRKWKIFQFMIAPRKGVLIYTYKMTQEMTQIFSFYVPVVTSVWFIGVMKNIMFGQQTSTFHAEEKWLEEKVVKKGFKRFTQTGLVPYCMVLRIRKKKMVSVLMMVHPLALQFAYECSNQCEDIYSESGSSKHVNKKIYIIESRIESSSERD